MTTPSSRTFAVAAALRSLVVDSATGEIAFSKTPTAELDFVVDWTAWLAAASDPADTIASFAVDAEDREPKDDDDEDQEDLVADTTSRNGALITFWLRHGFVDDEPLAVSCAIVTAGGRKESRTLWITIAEA